MKNTHRINRPNDETELLEFRALCEFSAATATKICVASVVPPMPAIPLHCASSVVTGKGLVGTASAAQMASVMNWREMHGKD